MSRAMKLTRILLRRTDWSDMLTILVASLARKIHGGLVGVAQAADPA